MPKLPLSVVFLLFSFFPSLTLSAQSDSTALARFLDTYQIKFGLGVQLWSTYTTGMEVYDNDQRRYVGVDNRLNTHLHRSRFSVSGRPYRTLTFNVTTAFDFVGNDVLSATETPGNNAPSPELRLWNATVDWEIFPNSPAAPRLIVGYFVAPIGRESTNGAFGYTSFEKAWSQNYLRRHLQLAGPGRAGGVILGGQSPLGESVHLTYEGALMNPVTAAYGGNSTGVRASLLKTARFTLHFGDPENERYSRSHRVNTFGERYGLSLGVGAATQGETDDFDGNSAFGLELMWNRAGFHLDGEYYTLRRSGNDERVIGNTGYLRVGKNLPLPRGLILEPVLSYWFFRGETKRDEVLQATRLGAFAGEDNGIDVGANLYFNPRAKFSLFYVVRSGSAGDDDRLEPAIINNFFQQPGVGAVRRGNYLGAGLVLVL